jgi:hypothetical protein
VIFLKILRTFWILKKKKSIKEFAEKLKKEQEHQNRWIEKFKSRYENNLDLALEKLMEKYYSKEYVQREYKIGFQPREKLLWLVFEYAIKYCKPCKNKKYWNTFTGEAYYIGNYVIQVMFGQGSALRIDKKK